MSTSANVVNNSISENIQKEFSDVELWKPVLGFEKSYLISNKGRLKGIDRRVKNKQSTALVKGVIHNPKPTTLGYIRYKLCNKNKVKSVFAHRLVAQSFLEKPTGDRTIINHKDGNKTNNNVSNLEWCNHSENTIHAIKIGLKKFKTGKDHHNSKTVLNLETGIYYNSIKDAFVIDHYSFGHFKNMVVNRDTNKTSFICV